MVRERKANAGWLSLTNRRAGSINPLSLRRSRRRAMTNRMRKIVRVALAGLIVIAAASAAQAQAPKGLAGTWKLNAAKSKFSPGPAPKDMTVTYTPTDTEIKIVVEMTPAEGPAQHWEMTGNYDGKEYPVTGN